MAFLESLLKMSLVRSLIVRVTGGDLPPRTHLAMFKDIPGCPDGTVLSAFSGWRPEMPLTILQCTWQAPLQRIIQSKMSLVPRLRNHDLGCFHCSDRVNILIVERTVICRWNHRCVKQLAIDTNFLYSHFRCPEFTIVFTSTFNACASFILI